jgi:hypothetical protein
MIFVFMRHSPCEFNDPVGYHATGAPWNHSHAFRVRIDDGARPPADRYARDELRLPDWRAPELPTFGDRVADFQFLLLVNAINFCFVESDDRPRWVNAKTGAEGAFGMFAALAGLYPSLLGEGGTLSSAKLISLTPERLAKSCRRPDRGACPHGRGGRFAREVGAGSTLPARERLSSPC